MKPTFPCSAKLTDDGRKIVGGTNSKIVEIQAEFKQVILLKNQDIEDLKT